MSIAVGDTLPEATLFELTGDGPKPVESNAVFGQGTVAVFGVPGAFTPTCHQKHMPSFIANAEALRGKGVDAIVCVTVNDPFVAGAWAEATGADKAGIRVLGDPTAAFVSALGITFDGAVVGLGTRAMRFSLVAKDGKVTFVATENAPPEMEATSAEKMLAAL
ncbi:MAG: peroxiredoxin [Pseudomonadota bacterium]